MRNTLLAILALMVSALPAYAQQSRCGPRDQVFEVLREKYSEKPTFEGIAENGSMFIVFASPTTGTWTGVAIRPNGMACLIITGTNFQPATALTPAGDDA